MTHPHDDTAPVEHDPTGMRELLAALPDPGPMPDDLVARITRALAEETATGSGHVVPMPRRSRPRLRHLGVAAAVVGAIGLGGIALSGLPGEVTASLEAGAGSDSAVSDTAESAAGGTAPSAGGEAADEGGGADEGGVDEGGVDDRSLLVPGSGSGRVVVVMSGTGYSSASLATSALALGQGGADPLPPLAAESPGTGPIATPIGARACADALGIAPAAGILVDVADVDGRPAAVLVVDDADGRTAYAVERSCTTGSPGLITGPVALG
ncbi:hypothetical protein GCM10023168_27210 [Fodinibacter luteus]|uniref:Uncharacterized protein n=1 Tax=Fodinibacter luteus TaxID=552064 RepID=A0ABP8KLM0_9MICO